MLCDWNPREKWLTQGTPDLCTLAWDKARRTLENHQPQPLPAGAGEDMQRLIAEYERELGLEN